MCAIANELEQSFSQRRLMGVLAALVVSHLPQGLARALGERPGELMASDNPDRVWRSNTPSAPPPWSWEGAWLPAVIQASPDLGALPPG